MLKKVAFVLALTICVSFALALESGPSNTVGFTKKTCGAVAPNDYTPVGLAFKFWDVVTGVPQYGVISTKPSDVIGAQLTGGGISTGDRIIRLGGSYAYRTTTAALWAGALETNSEMVEGRTYMVWNRHPAVGNQNLVLAGQVDTSAFGPIAILSTPPNDYTGISFRDARVRNRANLNLLTCGFTGGGISTSDRLIELGGSYAYYNTGTSAWAGGLVNVTPMNGYMIWNRHAGHDWNYTYGPGAVSRPPDRPGSDDGKINVNRPPSRPSSTVR